MTYVEERAAIQELLDQYRAFEECILVEARLREFGTVFELDFDVIWESADADDTRIADPARRVAVALHGVESVEMRLPLPPGLADDPSAGDWGLAEVAAVRLESAPNISEKPSSPHRLVVAWERDRRIEASFGRLSIDEVERSDP